MALEQEKRLLSFNVAGLANNELLVNSFNGQEEISRLFEFSLDLVSDNNSIKAEDVVGKNVTFSTTLADDSPRYFNGFINRFSAGDEDENGRRNYSAEVVPWMWFLTQTADCRIFQNQTVPQIIEQIFQDLGFSDFETSEIKGQHKEWEYCVQYRETDFNFVSRLMEQEGIFYYFKHEEQKHILVLGDQKNAYKDCIENEVNYPGDWGSRPIEDYITSWEHRYEFHSGKWAQTDFNFKTPSTPLMSQTNTKTNLPNIKNFEVYDYPGDYIEKGVGDAETRLRIEEEEVRHNVVEASSLCKTFTPGGKFKIKEHRAKTEEGKTFVITSVQHTASQTMPYETGAAGGDEYTNSFTAIPDSVVYRPARITPKPLVSGVQTAIVVGPDGEEIYPDEFGRVKVQFHWDREGQRDENSSCWIRVSQIHAGKGFGTIDLPRIGEEVIVDFLEGDPDRPIIIGRVYHAENMPPFGLPDSKTVRGAKSKTYKGGGYNEFVMDDTPGNEMVREHAQFNKDTTVENDQTLTVHNNRTSTIDVDDTESIGSNQTIKIGSNQTENIGANRDVVISSNDTLSVGSKQTVSVSADRALNVSANNAVSVGASQSVEVSADHTLSAGSNITVESGANTDISAGANITVTAAGTIKLTAGGSTIELGAGGIKITTGALIDMHAGGIVDIKGAIIKENA